MGGLRTVELPGTQQDTAADDSSVGPLPRKSDCVDDARTKNGMHQRRK